MVTGAVDSLHRWPVKSMAGEAVTALYVDQQGAPGDRVHAVYDVFKGAPRRMTARETPRLLAWSARYEDSEPETLRRAAPPQPTVTSPGGVALSWDDPLLATALTEDLGRSVSLLRDTSGQQDRPATLLVTVEASLRAAQAALAAPLDLRRFRPNLHLALDAPPFAERDWTGRTLHVGEARLEVLEPCVRCVVPARDPDTQAKWPCLTRWLSAEQAMTFGIIARPRQAALVRFGDAVQIG